MTYKSETIRELGSDAERGFSLIQLLITFAIVAIVSSAAVINIRRSQSSLALQNSVRKLAGNMERARIDAVRRHSTSTVTFTSPTSYNLSMDFGGSGVSTTRTYNLESGIGVISTPLPSATFDWRGRTSSCTLTFALQNPSGEQSWVDVSEAGDVTVNADVDVLPTASYTSVSSAAEIASGTVVPGTGVHNNTATCGEASEPPSTPITGTGPGGCTMSGTPSSLSIRKNGGGAGSVTISPSSTVTVTSSGPTNLSITPASRSIPGGGTGTFTIQSTNNTRGTFAVNFSSSCTTITTLVKVTN